MVISKISKALKQVDEGLQYYDTHKEIQIHAFRQRETFGMAILRFNEALKAKKNLE